MVIKLTPAYCATLHVDSGLLWVPPCPTEGGSVQTAAPSLSSDGKSEKPSDVGLCGKRGIQVVVAEELGVVCGSSSSLSENSQFGLE